MHRRCRPGRPARGRPGLLGYMFWVAEKPSTRGVGTVPPNTCQGGVGSKTYGLAFPMDPLREH